jgi:hypothetical protein
MQSSSNERQIELALQAIRADQNLSIRKAATIYNVPRSTLAFRLRGRVARVDTAPNSRNLDLLEEDIIVREILDWNSRGFPPRYRDVEDMANRLRTARDASRVGKRWASNFVKRQPQLRTRFTRPYDYQRALCEDPKVIEDWFRLVRNTITKYGIVDSDIWNFDETGFLMGQITSTLVVTSSDRRGKTKALQPGDREWATLIAGVNSSGYTIPPFVIVAAQMHLESWYRNNPFLSDWVIAVSENGWTTNELGLEWIKHFEKHSRSRTIGAKRLLILDGHDSHHSDDFEHFCKENDIITLCMPPHSSHLLQPLDVGCFRPLKNAYGKQVENLMRVHLTHITKPDFFVSLYAAFQEALKEENIQGGFRGAGIVPFNPDAVLSKLDVRFRTPTPTEPTISADPWTSKTPQNAYEATSQSDFIKDRIARHQDSSPTAIFEAMDQLVKSTKTVMHQMVLMQDRVRTLEEANRTISKRRRAKRTYIQEGGILDLETARDILASKDVGEQITQETRTNAGGERHAKSTLRRCSKCGRPGHNARTCRDD